jgi:hypothetical protein
MPTPISSHCPSSVTPDATTPQANAHIGGNQVIGFSNSATAERDGRAMLSILHGGLPCVNKS